MENLTASANPTLTRTTGTLNGRGYELATHQGGRTEIYEDYSDAPGLPCFLGYLDALLPHFPATFARDLAPLLAAHEAAHLDHWATFLPGAESWLHT